MNTTKSANNETVSNRKRTLFWNNFFIKCKENKKIFIIICILQIISLPLLITMMLINYNNHLESVPIYMALAVFAITLATASGVIIAINNFSYLYKKSKVDMIYSLPLTSKQRFLGDFFSGLAVYLIPYIASMAISLAIYFIGMASNVDFREDVISNGLTPFFIKTIICGLLIMLMLYTLTVLVISCCGSLFECIVYIGLINIFIPVSIYAVCFLCFNDLRGINIMDTANEIVSYCSPFGGVLFVCLNNILFGYLTPINVGDNYANNVFVRWIIIYFIITIAMFAITFFLYKKRKAEDVSKPFVFKFLYYIIITVITLCIFSLTNADELDNSFIPIIIFSAIVYMIFEVITNRGFKKIGSSVIRYTVTVIAISAITAGANSTRGFNVEKYVPNKSSIKSVSISYRGLNYENTSAMRSIVYTDDKCIDAILKTHDDVVSNINNQYGYENSPNNIDISYTLKSGSHVTRSYFLNNKQLMLLNCLNSSDSYINAMGDAIRESFGGNYNASYLYSKLRCFASDYQVSENTVNDIINAYKQDMKNMTEQEYLAPDDIYCFFYNDIPVRSSFVNTIAVLNDNGLRPNTLDDEIKSYLNLNNKDTMFIIKPDSYRSFGGNEFTSSLGEYNATEKNIILLSSPKVQQLLKVSQPFYTTTDNCYVIIFNGNRYVVPKEYDNLAEEVMKSSQKSLDTMDDTEISNNYEPEDYDSYYWNNHQEYDYDLYNKGLEEWKTYWFSYYENYWNKTKYAQ